MSLLQERKLRLWEQYKIASKQEQHQKAIKLLKAYAIVSHALLSQDSPNFHAILHHKQGSSVLRYLKGL